MIGSNNHNSTADQIVEGIESIVWSIASKLTSAKIVVLVRKSFVAITKWSVLLGSLSLTNFASKINHSPPLPVFFCDFEMSNLVQ